MKKILIILFTLLSLSVFGQPNPLIDTVFATANIKYEHTSDVYQNDGWLYIIDTGNDCDKWNKVLIDFNTRFVPDRFILRDQFGNFLLDTGWIGTNSWQAPPGEQFRTGFLYFYSDGGVSESYELPSNWQFPPFVGGTNYKSCFRMDIETTLQYIYLEVFPNPYTFTIFDLIIHPNASSGSDHPVVYRDTSYTCDINLVHRDTFTIGVPPCDTIHISNVLLDPVLDNGPYFLNIVVEQSSLFELCSPEFIENPSWNWVYTECIEDSIYYNTEYLIQGWTEMGCNYSETVVVYQYKEDIYIPNAFSPNYDGKNDIFTFYTRNEILEQSISIYDRWGGLMHESEEIASWNGYCNNKVAEEGVYVYVIELTFLDHETRLYKGDITLLK
jgi:gliding motility-associated-like protein